MCAFHYRENIPSSHTDKGAKICKGTESEVVADIQIEYYNVFTSKRI